MVEKQVKITQNTLLPLSLIIALAVLSFQIGGSYSKVDNNTKGIMTLRSESKDVLKTLKNVESKLVRIETSLEMLAK